ncbi:hypothetical protein Taro_006284 [Colocasia esculenta]|uniref:Uncharacterized protein n=1 Tax=Colocasia esculenta TaxID=4460 RepID=A0A843TNB5_COLES|nr:hypothetical protein [Colocasia esculenta]
MGKGAATIALTRRGRTSRQPPCRDGKPGRNSSPYRDCQVRRDKVASDHGDASTDVATRWPRDAPSRTTHKPHKHPHTGRGAWGKL